MVTLSEVRKGRFMTRLNPRLSPCRFRENLWVPDRAPRTLIRPALPAGSPRKLISVQTEAFRAVGPGVTVAGVARAVADEGTLTAMVRRTANAEADFRMLFKGMWAFEQNPHEGGAGRRLVSS